MRQFIRYTAAALCVALSCAAPLRSQETSVEGTASEEDRGFLAGLLEDSLGGEGREIRIIGFAGALSSEASVERITVADDNGIWLTMEEVVLDWNRSALLRGRLEVTTLSAQRIAVERTPLPAEGSVPSPEASGFSLPDLPVAVDVQTLEVAEISLGESLLGEPAVMNLAASLNLVGGSGHVDLRAQRVDGKIGEFIVDTTYDGDSDVLSLSLDLREAEGGIIGRALDLPGQPSVELTVAGEGPLSDLAADVSLRTAGQERLAGQITLRGDEATENDIPARQFTADLEGDLAPLFPAAYAEFFGDQVVLQAEGSRSNDGALDLSEFLLETGASRISGAVSLAGDYTPLLVQVEGVLQGEGDAPVTLPMGGGDTTLRRAGLVLDYDADEGEDWTGSFELTDLSGADYAAEAVQLSALGQLENGSEFSGDLEFSASGLTFDDASIAQAVGSALAGKLRLSQGEAGSFIIDEIDVNGGDYGLTGRVEVEGLEDDFATRIAARLSAQDLGRFSGLAGVNLAGSAGLDIVGTVDLGGAFNMDVSGATVGLETGIERVDPLVAGLTSLSIKALRDAEGMRVPELSLQNDQLSLSGSAELATDAATAQFDLSLADSSIIDPSLEGAVTLSGSAAQAGEVWTVDAKALGPLEAVTTLKGSVTGPQPSLTFDARLPDISPLAPQYSGAAQVSGTAVQGDAGWVLDTVIAGPYNLSGTVKGRVTGADAPDVSYDLALPNVQPFVPSISGRAALRGTAQLLDEGLVVDTFVEGPYGLNGTVAGRVTGENAPNVNYDLNLPNVNPLVPSMSGRAAVRGSALVGDAGVRVDTVFEGPYGTSGTVAGLVTGDAPSVTYALRVPDVGPLGVPLNGPLAVEGTAQESGGTWRFNTGVSGLAGVQARIDGSYGGSNDLNLTASGTAPLELATPFIRPRSLTGQAQFDLAMNGRAALEALTGTVTTSGARLSIPSAALAVEDIGARITFAGGRANLQVNGGLQTGGSLSVSGPVTLSGGYPADLAVALNGLTITDPTLYETTLDGRLAVSGPLRGGAQISGQIDVGETNVQVPNASSVGFAIIPQIAHVNPPAGVARTLSRAGLDGSDESSGDSGSSSSIAYPLNVRISAPSRIYVRGRGLDAELGGTVTLLGTTQDILTRGQFSLIRGRLDVLGQRFTLDEGTASLQGDFDPFIYFAATTDTDSGTASVIIQGRASSPEVSFESVPEAPEDEVIAQIFFGQGIENLSAFQTIQLASAVATLSGNGGVGLISNLRKTFNLDDLDVVTDDEGNTGVRVGKYISDKVYTDVEVGNSDTAGVSINVDISPSFTARGQVKSDGDTSIGIFFERDY
ncbi:translocation/assembly module TamB domain-containing protein [Alphaproteobacteria bacterium KMM 3653]|uniref:Translocation/assembly module TamB domain-containing protein n=1 Tax=Harenicola maris TaxID=2841044 RepID=A0AAP2CR95_9RHOB|nr:translocation/assembly module TamB domain-containing protein [Harenicola maris]